MISLIFPMKKKTNHIIILITLIAVPTISCIAANTDSIWIYSRPKPFSFITNMPEDFRQYGIRTFRKENIDKITGVTIGTVALVFADQYLLDKSQILGNKLKIDGNSSQKTYFEKNLFNIGPFTIEFTFNGPHDASTAMYFLGDGWLHIAIAGGYWIYGLSGKNNRALQTASALAESMLNTGIAVQFVKHISGRQSPFVSDVPGGRWRPFPNQIEYHKKVPQYDAYPSGHIATAISTTIVLAEMYPEYKFIRPMGYVLSGILGYAMMNNGVHWISDYPLGIAFGYTFAKIAVQNARKNAVKISKFANE